MHTTPCKIPAALVAAIALAGCQSLAPDAASAAQVEAAHAKLAAAYSACDAAAFAVAYAEAFTFVTSNTRQIIRTESGLRAYLAAGCALKPNPTATVKEQSLRFVGSDAVITGQYLFRVPDGTKVVDVLQNFTVVFVRQSGAWKVSARHVSLVP